MKKYVKASKVDLFLKYHDDENNWRNNQDGFDKMYEILEQYDDSNGNDPVDVAFEKATSEDQDRMLELITPKAKFGQPGYALRLFNYASDPRHSTDTFFEHLSRDYCEGVVDTIKCLLAEGYLDPTEWDNID